MRRNPRNKFRGRGSAIINNGPIKGCEPNFFKAISSAESVKGIYQLHRNIRPDGDVNNVKDATHIANENEKCDGNYVKLSVDPEGKSYTVSIPATKHEQKYDVAKK